MFTGLGHRAVSSGNNQDRAVHLGSTGDHVLDVVGVARAVDVSVMTLVGLVFDVCGIDCDTTGSFFRSLVDVVVRGVAGLAAHCEDLGDRSGQGGFAVVNMADRADIDVGLVSFKFCLCHWG